MNLRRPADEWPRRVILTAVAVWVGVFATLVYLWDGLDGGRRVALICLFFGAVALIEHLRDTES